MVSLERGCRGLRSFCWSNKEGNWKADQWISSSVWPEGWIRTRQNGSAKMLPDSRSKRRGENQDALGWVARDRHLREQRPAAAGHAGAIEVSRAELQQSVHCSIQCIYGLKCRDLPMPLPLDAAVSTASIQTYSYTIQEYIYIYTHTSIHLYSVRITMKVARWMKSIRRYRDGKSEHYWSLDIIYIPPDSVKCTIQKTPWLNLSIMHKPQNTSTSSLF